MGCPLSRLALGESPSTERPSDICEAKVTGLADLPSHTTKRKKKPNTKTAKKNKRAKANKLNTSNQTCKCSLHTLYPFCRVPVPPGLGQMSDAFRLGSTLYFHVSTRLSGKAMNSRTSRFARPPAKQRTKHFALNNEDNDEQMTPSSCSLGPPTGTPTSSGYSTPAVSRAW